MKDAAPKPLGEGGPVAASYGSASHDYSRNKEFPIEELPTSAHTIPGVTSSIALFVGWSPRGPTDQALRLASFSDYERDYGGLDPRSLLGYSVRHFFDNGGTDAHVIRVAGTDGAVIGPADVEFQNSSGGSL